jgi:hypothetical protein
MRQSWEYTQKNIHYSKCKLNNKNKFSYTQKNIHYSKCKLNNKNKLDLIVLLILRLLSTSTDYKNLAMQDHDENLKELLGKKKKDLPSLMVSFPFKVHSPC